MTKVLQKAAALVLSAAQLIIVPTFGSTAFAANASVSADTISVGENHSLIIRSDKTLWAAGDNSYGQLGVSDVSSSQGVKVLSDIVFAEANDNVSFAIDSNGTLYGWGDNSCGQVSPASRSEYITSPTVIMNNVSLVSAGNTHTVAVTTDGTAYGWGSNEYGELGFAANSLNNSSTELKTGVVDAAAGDGFTLLVTENGGLYACGNNDNGALGIGSYRSQTALTEVFSSGVSAVEVGNNHSLILKTDGTVYAAGLNDSGQLGDGSTRTSSSFVSTGLKGMSAVFAGGNSSGALSSTGTVYVWGDNASSQLHNGKSVNLSDPTSLTSGAASIAFGEHHSLMLKTSGSVSSAGSGAFGELFSKAADSTASPELIMKDVSSYSAGYDHAAAVDANGRLYTWGNNDCGQLGLGDTVMRTEPTRVTSVKADFAKVWCGNKVTFALTTDGDVYVFGENSNNLLGTKTKTKTVSTPTINSYLYDKSRNIEIYPSDGFCLALIDGAVYGWGSNSAGRLLDLNKTVSEPTELTSGLGSITKLAVGSSHVLALDSRGTVWVWGSNSLRQLGFESDSYIVDEPTALEITNSKGETVETSFNDIAAAESHSLVVGSDGKLWAFGTNSSGQLGTSDYRLKTPTSITTGISSVYAGASVCAVIDTNGKLYLSGSNTNGALGDGTVTDRSNFYNITLTKAKSASIGNGFAGAIDTDNSLYCWGDNSFGAVGNGSGGAKSEPETVIKDALCLSIKQAEGISLSKTELTVKPNGTASLKATITPSDASANVTWTSSDSRIATVTDGGIVKGVALGTATITASTSNGLTASCLVTVTVPVTSFSVTPSKSKTLDIGKSFTITSKIYPTNATDKTLLYSSSDEDVAEVSASGKVTALSSGRTVITVTAKSNPAKTRKITVTVRPAKVVITSRKSTTNGVKLKWNDAEGADGYEVFRKLSGSSSSAKSVGDAGDSNSFTDDTAKKGKTYVYSVKSYVVIDGKKVYSANSKQYKITGK